MEAKKRISSNGIYFKKYILSWLFPFLIFLFFKIVNINSGFIYYLVWFFVIMNSLIYLFLKKTEFNNENVFFNNVPYNYLSIVDLKSFELNRSSFVIFITDSKNLFKKIHMTQLSLGGFFKISTLKRTFSGQDIKEGIPFFQFVKILKEKSKIKKLDWE